MGEAVLRAGSCRGEACRVRLPRHWSPVRLPVAPGVGAAPPTDTSALTDAVTVEGVRAHQAELQAIATANGGTREASTPGYFELSRLRRRPDGGRRLRGHATAVRIQLLRGARALTLAGTSAGFPFTYVEGVDISTMDYSGDGTLRAASSRRPTTSSCRYPSASPTAPVQLGLRGRGLRRVHRRHRPRPARHLRLLASRSPTRSRGRRRRGDRLQRGQHPRALGVSSSARRRFPQAVPVLEMSAAGGRRASSSFIRSRARRRPHGRRWRGATSNRLRGP